MHKKDNKVIIYSLKHIKYELAEKSKIIYNLACPCSWNIQKTVHSSFLIIPDKNPIIARKIGTFPQMNHPSINQAGGHTLVYSTLYTVLFGNLQACGVFSHSLSCDHQTASEDQTGELQTCLAQTKIYRYYPLLNFGPVQPGLVFWLRQGVIFTAERSNLVEWSLGIP